MQAHAVDADCPTEWACTEPSCEGGACVYEPVDCDDSDPCTWDHCRPDEGCVHEVIADCGTPCDTVTDCPPPDAVCKVRECSPVSGTCLILPLDCSDGDLCTLDACNPLENVCENTPIPGCQ